MAHNERILTQYLGFVAWGDFGPYTMYTNKNGHIVLYLKAPPKKPLSQQQLDQLQAMHNAATAWNALPELKRYNWETLSRRLSLKMHGYNCFVHFYLVADTPSLQTVARQAQFALTDLY
jgi:hypothetical protein